MATPPVSVFHSRFTPSLLSAEVLGELFVQRSSLLARIVSQIEQSARTQAKHQILLVGPRGIGKTHLLALAYHRLKARVDLRDLLCLAWLREEEWGVDSFVELLRRILLALDREAPTAGLRERIRALREEPRDVVRLVAERLLTDFLGGRTLLVLCENLDDLFHGLGEQGQQELRAFLQEKGSCSLLCTAQSLFDSVSRQTAPFYGFFRTEKLLGLEFEEATELVRRLAEHVGDQELVEYLDTSEGRARLRAIQHLSGGNHRVYVVLSQFLTRKSLEELVPPLLDLLDALTPYYQSRMQVLEASQRKLVEALCERRGAASVEDLAKDCFLEVEAAGRWLRDLWGKGYVSIRGTHEEPFYELQEPLLRLCLGVKAEREEPLRLLVEFLRLWYTRPELEARLEVLPPTAIEREYIQVALSLQDGVHEIIAACLQDFTQHFAEGDYQRAHQAADDLLAVDKGSQQGWALKIWSLLSAGERDQAIEASQQCIEATSGAPIALSLRAVLLTEASRWAEALPLWQRMSGQEPSDANARIQNARCLAFLERWPEAESAAREALNLDPASRLARHMLAGALLRQRRYDEAIELFDDFSWEEETDPMAFGSHAALLLKLKRFAEASSIADRALALAPDHGDLLTLRADIALHQNQTNQALEFSDRALQQDPQSWQARLVQYRAYLACGRVAEAQRSILSAEQISPQSWHVPEVWMAFANLLLRQGRMGDALTAMETLLRLEPEEDEAAWALANRALPLLALGRLEEAESTLQAALERRPGDVTVLTNLGEVLSVQGRHSEAIEMLVKATGLAPNSGNAWGHYGLALARAGNLQRAGDAFSMGRQHGDNSPVTRYEAIGVQIARHHWPEAVEALRQALPTFSEPEIHAFQAVLRYLLQTREDAPAWPERTRKLVTLFRQRHRVPFLAQALTRGIEQLRSAPAEDRQRWLAAWKSSAEKEPQMQPALRLLETAVLYLESPGPRPLLRLPSEERALLLPLLQLQHDPTDPGA